MPTSRSKHGIFISSLNIWEESSPYPVARRQAIVVGTIWPKRKFCKHYCRQQRAPNRANQKELALYPSMLKTQVSRFVFYPNRHLPTNLNKVSISGELHAFKCVVKPPSQIERFVYARVTGWVCAVVSRVRYHFPHKTKHVRQCLIS